MLKKLFQYLGVFLVFACMPLVCRDVLLEFKGAYYFPTNHHVRDIYGNGSGLYGPEVTVQLCEGKDWYGFASADFLKKKGHSAGLCEPTTLYLVPLALGAKYFVPFSYGDFYLGLGFQPTHVKTVNCISNTVQRTSKWGFGGIAKAGAYFDLPRNFFIDVFFDYSFVKVGGGPCCGSVIPVKAHMNGAIFGAGLGYRFD